MKILILCTGNSCRSQMAQGFLQSFDNRIEIHSAGTDPSPKVSSKALKVMAEAGIDISRHFPKNVDRYIAEEWDYVITVCDQANETCPVFLGLVKHRLHFDFEDPAKVEGTEKKVLNEFRKVRDQIKKEFSGLYNTRIKLSK